MRFSLLSLIFQNGVTMTPSEFEQYVAEHYGNPPLMHRMVLRDSKADGLGDFECWASWRGYQRRAGFEFTVTTAAGTPVHRFVVPAKVAGT